MPPQPPKKLRKTASTASNWGWNVFLMSSLNSWRNSYLFEKKKFICTKHLVFRTTPSPPQKKPYFFFAKMFCDKLTCVFGATEKLFFSKKPYGIKKPPRFANVAHCAPPPFITPSRLERRCFMYLWLRKKIMDNIRDNIEFEGVKLANKWKFDIFTFFWT